MKTLYLECSMGASGDMMMSSLLALIENKKEFIDRMNALGLPGVKLIAEKSEKAGIVGEHVRVLIDGEEEAPGEPGHTHEHMHGEHSHTHEDGHVHTHDREHEHAEEHTHEHVHGEHSHTHEDGHVHTHSHSHSHTSVADVEDIVEGLAVSEAVKHNIRKTYSIIAMAESKAHGKPVSQIHFHEVGQMDAIVDITGACMLMEMVAPERIIVSPVHVGSGTVKCAHGIMPVPAPATAEILKGVPIYSGNVNGELCTPTGAALIKCFADAFGDMPMMAVDKVGYGMGTKDFPENANCLRAFIGETTENNLEQIASRKGGNVWDGGIVARGNLLDNQEGELPSIVKLECNIDDMTAEDLAFSKCVLLEAGARDVYTTAINMKKNRDGIMLSCLCDEDDAERMARLIFRHTTTIGIRMEKCSRYRMERSLIKIDTKYGPIRIKVAEGFGIRKFKPEYDDVAEAAEKYDKTFGEISLAVVRAAREMDL